MPLLRRGQSSPLLASLASHVRTLSQSPTPTSQRKSFSGKIDDDLPLLYPPPLPSSPDMAPTGFHSLEPFPLFIDSAPPELAEYFSNVNMTLLDRRGLPHMPRRPRISVPTKVSNYFYLQYYQYEVTFGLYMLTPTEKVVLNSIIVGIFVGLLYALHVGLGPFAVRMFCRLLYYITGSLGSGGELCQD